MPKRTREYRDSLLEDLQNPEEASQYLNAALEDSDEMFLGALRDVAEAKQMAKVASAAGVARESLYRTLCKSGNPRYRTFRGVLNALGVRMYFQPIIARSSNPEFPGTTSPNEVAGIQGIQSSARKKGPSKELAYGHGITGSNCIAAAAPFRVQ